MMYFTVDGANYFVHPFFCCCCGFAFFNITVIAEVFLFHISERRTDWGGPYTLQNISTSPYFFISKCHILILYYSNLTRRIFWHFLGCTVHQAHRIKFRDKSKTVIPVKFFGSLGQVMCNWKKMKSTTNTERLSAYPEIQLVSLLH